MRHQRSTNRIRRTRRAARLAGAEDGQALVELALVLPVLLLLVFGIVQLSLAASLANDETHLANEVARYAVVNEDPLCPKGSVCTENKVTGLAAWGKAQVDGKKVLTAQTVCIRFLTNVATGTSRQVGDPVEVVVKGTMNWSSFFQFEFTSTNLESKAVMRLEAPPSIYGEECA
jgi:hypothetical protein